MTDYESGYDSKYGYNKNAFAHGTIGTRFAGSLVKAFSAPIGLTSEALQDYRESKRSKALSVSLSDIGEKAPSDDPQGRTQELNVLGRANATRGDEAIPEFPLERGQEADGDEADWTLDEIVASREQSCEETTETSASSFRTNDPLPTSTDFKIPYSVVLPQRRPGTKARGFVRAYAPVLADAGISQDAFLKFLHDFHRAAQASPIFDVVMIATALAAAYPDPIVGAAVQAVQIVAGVGKEMQERWRTNKFLARANKDIFMPRDLFAMVVTYKPTLEDDTQISLETVDWSAMAIAKHGKDLLSSPETQQGPEDGTILDKGKLVTSNLRIASAKSVGESEMAACCASLIFPNLESAAAAIPGEERKTKSSAEALKATSRSTSKWLNDYYDRRAQASYNSHNPDTTLARIAPETPKFKSRFADPNDAVNTHLFTLLTGGRFKAEPLGAKRRWKKAQRKAAETRAQGLKVTPTKRMLQEDVLYLMVVNMPTKEELEKARKQLAVQPGRKSKVPTEQSISA